MKLRTILTLTFALLTCSLTAATDGLYLDASVGILAGHFDAFQGGTPNYRYERAMERFSPAVGIGYHMSAAVSLEEEFDSYGTFRFDNVYSSPMSSWTDYWRNRITERLWAATTRLTFAVPITDRVTVVFAPGVEYQVLHQTATYLGAWTIPFSLPQVYNPSITVDSRTFVRPDLDIRLACQLSKRWSSNLAYRILESPAKTLSRISVGVVAHL